MLLGMKYVLVIMFTVLCFVSPSWGGQTFSGGKTNSSDNKSSDNVIEMEKNNITNCKHLGTVEAYKDLSKGFAYSLIATKEKLKVKVSKLGGNAFVMDSRFSQGTSTQVIRTLQADAYKCN